MNPSWVPTSRLTTATGLRITNMPGGWTKAKSRYGRTPVTRWTALAKYTPESYNYK